MMGYVWLLAIVLAVLAGLAWLGRFRAGRLQLAGAALMIGAAGYAWQGQPGYAGTPQASDSIRSVDRASDMLLTLREKMDRNFGPAKSWLITSDGLARAGSHRASAAYLEAGLKENPRSADLWNALGVQMLLIGEGQMSPASELAFDCARQFNPRHPGPDYFAGLAALTDNRPEDALRYWDRVLADAPAEGEWQPIVAMQRERLGELLAALRQTETRRTEQAQTERGEGDERQ